MELLWTVWPHPWLRLAERLIPASARLAVGLAVGSVEQVCMRLNAIKWHDATKVKNLGERICCDLRYGEAASFLSAD